MINYFEETEYPLHHDGEMLDYSKSAISNFQNYLRHKYDNVITNLNREWNYPNIVNNTADFTSFTEIDPKIYNWHLAPFGASINSDITNYDLFTGRRDWVQYRSIELKSFIDALYQIHRKQHVRFGVRFGSIHDSAMEARGFYDITPLVENADWIHVAAIIEQAPNSGFEIQADYLRSISNFWGERKGKTVRFSEESNWRDYNNHSPSKLSNGWNNQIDAFKARGSSAHYIFGWDKDESWLQSTIKPYLDFINHLGLVRNTDIIIPDRSQGIHLSEARMAINLGNIFQMILPEGNFSYQVYNTTSLDFVTDYMLNYGDTYLNKYSVIYLPKGSYHIAQNTLSSLLNRALTPLILNSTHFVSGYGQFLVTNGIANWVWRPNNDYYRLIWRTRPDAMQIWQNGNKADPDQADIFGISPELDFIEWLIENNKFNLEYPEFNLTYANWDQDMFDVWYNRSDLQNVFPDG